MDINVLGKPPHTVSYSVIVHIFLHFRVGKYWRVIHGCKRLFQLRRLLKEIHDLLKIIFRARCGRGALLVQGVEKHIILLDHVIWASTAILDGGGEANVRGRLREDWRVELVILEITEDRLWSWDVSLIYFAPGSGIYRGLQMDFLWNSPIS